MIGFILNIPYSFFGLIVVLLSVPTGITFSKEPYAFIIKVKKLWWLFGYMKNGRAVAIGHVVILGPHLEDKDLEHELVHIEQYQRAPIIHPILYYLELMRKGYRNNKYEEEAYRKAGNIYKIN